MLRKKIENAKQTSFYEYRSVGGFFCWLLTPLKISWMLLRPVLPSFEWRFSHSLVRWYLSKFPLLVAGAHFCIDRRTVHFDLFVLIVLPALSFSSFCRFVHSGSSLRWYARIDFCSLCTFFRWTVRTRTLFEWFIYLVAFFARRICSFLCILFSLYSQFTLTIRFEIFCNWIHFFVVECFECSIYFTLKKYLSPQICVYLV